MKLHLWLIQLLGVIVPRRLRADWRREWEAELNSREEMLSEWDRLDWRGKFDLMRHHQHRRSEAPRMFMYRSILQHYHRRATVVLNAAGDPGQAAAAVREELRALDPQLAPTQIGSLDQHMALALFPARVLGTLLAAFGLLALALAIIGLTGVIAYTVSQRRKEIGVRMALGATCRDVLWLIIRQGLALGAFGLAFGVAGALGLTRFLSSLLYGVSATDPLTYLGVSILLAATTLLACYIPARRAARTDPLTSLRRE